jgi:hypothetical protein
MHYVCALLPHSDLPVDELCLTIKEDAQMLAENIYTEEGRTLVAVLRRTLAMVAAQDMAAYIECLSCLPYIAIAHLRYQRRL